MMLEVLSPAGSEESLQAAVRAGADAVYLGGSLFSARASAKNFTDEDLKAAVEYCHERGVKVHLAVNTLLREDELLPALRFLRFACSLPVDAVLVQDPGLFILLRQAAPSLPLHASTQTSVHGPAGVRLLEKAGFSRAVLAREMSLEQIAEARNGTKIELEAFVHGALCMSVSGQCYLSAMLGGRSGNRGMCAQPCRLPFSGPNGTGRDLSLKDLSMIPRVAELAAAGVTSMKIEGRMKRPEYVAAATRACRLAADGQPVPQELLQSLSAVFSRSGFTAGYPDAALGREMFGTRGKEDVTAATNAVFSGLRGLYKDEAPRVSVSLFLTVRRGEPVSLCAEDERGLRCEAVGEPPQAAVNRPLTQERCAEQLSKTGGTPFYAQSVTSNIEDNLSVPVSALNALRREALNGLLKLRGQAPPVPFSMPALPQESHTAAPLRLRARFSEKQVLSGFVPDAAVELGFIYVPYTTPVKELNVLRGRGFRVALELPRGMFGTQKEVSARLSLLKEAGFAEVWAGSLDAASLALELGLTVHGGFSLNVWNSAALACFSKLCLADIELSCELTLTQAERLGGEMPRGLVLYGRQPLMLTRNCPAANGGCFNSSGGCFDSSCGEAPVLTDRLNIQFPVQCFGGCTELLNSVPLYMADRMREVKNVDFGVLRFTTETKEEISAVLQAYKTAAPPPFPHTRGLLYRGVE